MRLEFPKNPSTIKYFARDDVGKIFMNKQKELENFFYIWKNV